MRNNGLRTVLSRTSTAAAAPHSIWLISRSHACLGSPHARVGGALWVSRCTLSSSRPPRSAYHTGPVNPEHSVAGPVTSALRSYRDAAQHKMSRWPTLAWARSPTATTTTTTTTATQGLRGLLCRLHASGAHLLVLIETPSIFLFSVVKHTLRISVLLGISTLELAGEVYRSAVHPYCIRFLRFAVGTPFLCGLVFLLVMRYWYFPEPRVELDTASAVAGLRYGGQAYEARPADPLVLKHAHLPSAFATGCAENDADGNDQEDVVEREDINSSMGAPTTAHAEVIMEGEFEEELEPRLCRTADELMRYTQALRHSYRELLMQDHHRRRRESEAETMAQAAAEASESNESTEPNADASTHTVMSSRPPPPPVLAAHDPANALSPALRNDLLHDVLWALRSLEENIMNTDEERAFVTPRRDLLKAPPQSWPGHSGVAAAAVREASPAEFTLRVLLSISIEQGWFDLVERTRTLFGDLVHNRPLPLQANVARAVGDLCVLSYEMDTAPLPLRRPARRATASSSEEAFLSGDAPYCLSDGFRGPAHRTTTTALDSDDDDGTMSWRRWWSERGGSWSALFPARYVHAYENPEEAVAVDEAACQRQHTKITMEQKRRVARAIDTFRPERAVEERPTIASEISLMPLQDGEQTTRCVGLIRHSAGRRPQLVLVFVGSNTASNWVTNLDYSTIPLPARYGVHGPPPASEVACTPTATPSWCAKVTRLWPWSAPASSAPSALVHRGFHDLVSTIPYKEMASDFDHIIVVGHSLGGALAQLAGLELAAERPSRRITVMTMASPRLLAVEPTAYKAFVEKQQAALEETAGGADTQAVPHSTHHSSLAHARSREDPIAEALTLPPNYRHIRGFLRPDAVPQLPPEQLCYTHTGRPLPLQTGCKSFSSFIATGMMSKLFHSADLYWQLLNQNELAIAQTHFYNHELGDDENGSLARGRRITASLIRQHVQNI